jgi:hypothetical protein
MNTLSKIIASVFVVIPVSASAATLTIGIDLSMSNPMLAHPNFARAAASYVSEQIAPLKFGDVVHVQTLGARNDPTNLLDQTYVIGKKVRSNAVAAAIKQFITSLPTRKNIAQSETNILSFLEFHSGLDCAASGQIIVLTDGLESSSTVSAQAFAEGKTRLPKPDVSLKGCTLTFYGLGAGLPPAIVKNIRAAWAQWSEQAGATFHAVIR